MTPQAKAKELVDIFEVNINDSTAFAKSFAESCVEEIIAACEYNNVEHYNTDWWNKVIYEIKLL